MLIVCPSCASEYTIDAAHLGASGRAVRCGSCRTKFHVAPPAADEAALAEMVAAVSATDLPAEEELAEPAAITVAAQSHREDAPRKPGRRRAAPARPARRRRLPAPAVLLLLAAGLGAGAALAREPVVRALPQAARLYAAAGLPVNLRGLLLADVAARQSTGEGGALIVEGDVVNASRRSQTLPDLAIEIRDATDAIVYRWTAEPPREALEPAESARFRAKLAAPPAEGHRVLVRFAPAAPAAPGEAPAGH